MYFQLTSKRLGKQILLHCVRFSRTRCLSTCLSKSSADRHINPWTNYIYFNDTFDASEPKFSKILVANRGEIAVRIMKTARRMGVKTVALYSDVDAKAPHVRMADESVALGGTMASESYLNMDKVMEAVISSRADAVHPGYGFLSENAKFVSILEQNGVTFIGPTASAIIGMGDKIQSKILAKKAGVNIIPGFEGRIVDVDHCVSVANDIGYPVMIKASAGGGGKGMRIARNDQEAREGFQLATEEAIASFADGTILVEKFIDSPRHIEIQILADKFGNVIHLNERECSIQRRNQKLIEEAPSMFVTPALRNEMGRQAVSLARQIDYCSAGTVEFLVDSVSGNFYFLEMNTRLQVEHPVTEFITGIDLVHQMLRVAKGHKLKTKQTDVCMNGWAIESRVYAEDPYRNFGMPSIGRLSKYMEPENVVPGVRCDSGVCQGTAISMYYDPLICKLISHGATRQEAIGRAIEAIDTFVIHGVTHNLALLRDVYTQQQFNRGTITTDYLSQTYPNGFKGHSLSDPDCVTLAGFAAYLHATDAHAFTSQTPYSRANDQPDTFHLMVVCDRLFTSPIRLTLSIHSQQLLISTDTHGCVSVSRNFAPSDTLVRLCTASSERSSAAAPSRNSYVQVVGRGFCGDYTLSFGGVLYTIQVYPEHVIPYLEHMRSQSGQGQGEDAEFRGELRAPMPGVMRRVLVRPGDPVREGDTLCVLEAMKMQNSLNASVDGRVCEVHAHEGEAVEEGGLLVVVREV